MDEFEKKRKHRNSHSSAESLAVSPTAQYSPIVGKREARKSFGTSRPSLDERDRTTHVEEKLSQKFKGRLRAFTASGKDRDSAKSAT